MLKLKFLLSVVLVNYSMLFFLGSYILVFDFLCSSNALWFIFLFLSGRISHIFSWKNSSNLLDRLYNFKKDLVVNSVSRQSRFAVWYWMLGAGTLGQPRGMVQGGRWEGGSGWGTCIYLWRMHVDVWQNQYNIVK